MNESQKHYVEQKKPVTGVHAGVFMDMSVSTDKYSTRKKGLTNGDKNQNSGS